MCVERVTDVPCQRLEEDWNRERDLRLAAEAERDRLRAIVTRVEVVVVNWGANAVHRPRSPHYRHLRSALYDGP